MPKSLLAKENSQDFGGDDTGHDPKPVLRLV
jgi:hypothetical protein